VRDKSDKTFLCSY